MFEITKSVIDVFTKSGTNVDKKTVEEFEKMKNYIDSMIDIHEQNVYKEQNKKILNEYLKDGKITKKEFNELDAIVMIRNNSVCCNEYINQQREFREEYDFEYKKSSYTISYSLCGYYEDTPRFYYRSKNQINDWDSGDDGSDDFYYLKILYKDLNFKHVKFENFADIMVSIFTL